MPGERPGKCGWRIAGCDACPAQKGGLPLQRGVSALPSLTVPPTLSVYIVRAEVDSIYPARKSNALLCPCPGHFTEAKSGTVRAKNAPGGWVHLPSLPAFLFAVTLLFLGRKPLLATVAHKGANTAFHSFGGIRRDATRPVGGPHKPSQGLTWGSAFWGCGVQFRSGHWWKISR